MSIKKLPHWVLVDKFPAFYDSESVSVVQQTARVYGKMNELVESYNKFIDLINEEIGKYEEGITKDFTELKTNLCKIITDYMQKIDTQVVHQDRMIAEVYDKFENHMGTVVHDLFQTMQDTGELETILENSVSEFIENLKTTLTADVTEQVNIEMNKSVTAAKNEVNETVNTAKSDLADQVVRGKEDITNTVEHGKEELKNAIPNVIEYGTLIYADQLPYGLSYTSQSNGIDKYDGMYDLMVHQMTGMGVQYVRVGGVEAGSTIIKSGDYDGYHIMIFRNNKSNGGYMISRYLNSELADTVDTVNYINIVTDGYDLDGNGVVDKFKVLYGDPNNDMQAPITLSNMPETLNEGQQFTTTVVKCTNSVGVLMYNDSSETDYTVFGGSYGEGDPIYIDKVTGKIMFY